jgi:hypothetical protein
MNSDMLLASVDGEVDDLLAAQLRESSAVFANRAAWTLGPPVFVDETDACSCELPEDEPIRTTGFVLDVTLPNVEPGTPRAEVEDFVAAIALLSRTLNVDFQLQLGDLYVGRIKRGVPNRLINDGLVATWSRAVG